MLEGKHHYEQFCFDLLKEVSRLIQALNPVINLCHMGHNFLY